ILEARAAGASAVLLIAHALRPARLLALRSFAESTGLGALVEIHDASELQDALAAGAGIVGVNSRSLDTFAIDTGAAWALLAQVPPHCIGVAESGMATAADVRQAADAGADAVLIGTALSATASPARIICDIIGVPRVGR
ncbi:MAG: indole-3-glycerol-phosphate synthase TrpC, partial [Gemmatimonadota bacterium]